MPKYKEPATHTALKVIGGLLLAASGFAAVIIIASLLGDNVRIDASLIPLAIGGALSGLLLCTLALALDYLLAISKSAQALLAKKPSEPAPKDAGFVFDDIGEVADWMKKVGQ